MSFTSWLSSIVQPRRRPIRKAAPRRTRLSVEPLEDRVVPSTLQTLASFDYSTTGGFAYSAPVVDSAGNLFGTNLLGGPGGYGTVYEVVKDSGTVTTLASFNYSNGARPAIGTLLLDSAGNLFGTTGSGGPGGAGTVFEIEAGSGTITTLASFDIFTNGATPYGSLAMDSAGNLFGTSFYSSGYGGGTVYEVVKDSGTVTTLATFDYTNGAYPLGGVILDSAGNLFGTAQLGGPGGYGTVFEVAAGSGDVTTLASFDYANGAYPYGGVILDSAGNLFGTTVEGGPGGAGTVFEIEAGSGTVTTLASFDYYNGAYPYFVTLVKDVGGNLYGTTSRGGPGGYGTVFEVAEGSGTITTLASFNYDNDYANGAYLFAGVTADSSGNLYGVTVFGGAYGYGTVFELAGVIAPSIVPSTTTATGGTFTYDGAPHAGSGSVDVMGGVVTLSYEGINGTVYSSLDAPTNAGEYTVTATYAGDAGHSGSSDSAALIINKAPSTTTTSGAGPFTYDASTHAGGSATVTGAGGLSTGATSLTYSANANGTGTADRINAGTYYVTAHYSGDANHLASDGAAVAITIQAKLLEATAWSQGTINIGSNGSIVLHVAVASGQFYNADTVYSLFNGVTFTIAVQKADGNVTYGTLTSVAKVETDGSITVSMQMNDSLRADLYDAYVNGRAVNFNMTATANGGNYSIDEDTMSKLLNNGALRYIV